MLLALLLVPFAVALVGFLTSRRVCWREFLLQVVVQSLVLGGAYAIARHQATADVEIWNGAVASKDHGTHGCCHSYPCNCRSVSCGKDCSTTVCDTCYDHSYDYWYEATDTTGTTVYSRRCARSVPDRWEAIRIGEPTAHEHTYTNYIKGAPDSILRRSEAAAAWAGKLPRYPLVYDHYRLQRVVDLGVGLPADVDEQLGDLAARLGSAKQVNVLLVAVKTGDESFLEALRQAWLGGKKNDVVVVLGMPAPPAIAWAGVLSWTARQDFLVDLRNDLLSVATFDASAVLGRIEHRVAAQFVRRPMADFEYLAAAVEPSTGWCVALFVLGLALAIGLHVVMVRNDVFGTLDNRRPFGYNKLRERIHFRKVRR